MTKCDYDFVVIGAGTIGLPTSVWLAEETSKSVLCLEAGSHEKTVEKFFGPVKDLSSKYHGASKGRVFGLGGTSTIWGGALCPFLPADCTKSWPFDTIELEPYLTKISHLFKFKFHPLWLDEKTICSDPKYIRRYAYWPSFSNRNVFSLLKKKISYLKKLKIKCNCPVISIKSYEHFNQVTFLDNGQNKKNITCKNLIVCAGAIESTRLSLLIEGERGVLRSGFSDHLSAPIGYLSEFDLKKVNEFSSFEFLSGNAMRNWRFEMSSKSSLREKLPPHNISLNCINNYNEGAILDGFQSIRLIMQSLQKRKFPRPKIIFHFIKNIDWIIKFVFYRLFKKILLCPQNSMPVFNLVIEQEVSKSNYVKLSEEKIDQFGNPAVEISWSMTRVDQLNIIKVVKEFELFWSENFEQKYGKIHLYDFSKIINDCDECGGIYHPTSSLSFAEGESAPIDTNLYLKSTNNIQFISTACLPSGGGVNPTMMALLLAARLVDQHAKDCV